jgi:hypothetical protein
VNLREASKLIRPKHIDEAVRLVLANDRDGFEWLYERTGRREPDSRYIVVRGHRFPTKAFGFLVAQIAGETDRRSNDLNVNQAAAPVVRHGGGIEVRSGARSRTQREEESRKISYYSALARPEQARFRDTLIEAHAGCAITGVRLRQAVEAAHVIAFARRGLNTLGNGILLRCDLHSLFDAAEMAIDPSTMKARFSERAKLDYADLDGVRIVIPAGGPPPSAFQAKWDEFRNQG